ncbi:MAG: peptide chain release factor-like protein [Chlamydiae bacterium]|jgi:protein subunit release factor B|nr:peptide chain release factor-like protein [Chlamydiota bacterium]
MVSQKKWEALKAAYQKIGLLEEDIEEKFILSSKKGGQNVNKTASCVQMKHIPSGIEVKCQEYRSQNENRYQARKILLDKYEMLILGKDSKKHQAIEKTKKQKLKRKKRGEKKYEKTSETTL